MLERNWESLPVLRRDADEFVSGRSWFREPPAAPPLVCATTWADKEDNPLSCYTCNGTVANPEPG